MKRQLFYGVADQFVCSGTNFVLPAVVSHVVSASEYGKFSIAYSAYVVCLIMIRSVTTTTLFVRGDENEGSDTVSAVAIAGLWSGVSAVVLCGLLIFLSASSGLIIAFSVGCVPLIVQDAVRYSLIAGRRSELALVNDVLTGFVFVLAVVVLAVTSSLTVTSALLCWVAGSVAGGLLGYFQLAFRGTVLTLLRFARENSDLARGLLGEAAGVAISTQSLIWIAGGSSLVLAATFRGAMQNVLGPAGVVLTAISPQLILHFRSICSDHGRVRHRAIVASILLALVFPTFAVIILILPSRVGFLLAGSSWFNARGVLIPASAAWAGTAVMTVISAALRFYMSPAAVRNFRVGILGLSVGIFAVLTLNFGLEGLRISLFVGGVSTIAGCLFVFNRVLRSRPRPYFEIPGGVRTVSVSSYNARDGIRRKWHRRRTG